jgi:hypothetical protein
MNIDNQRRFPKIDRVRLMVKMAMFPRMHSGGIPVKERLKAWSGVVLVCLLLGGCDAFFSTPIGKILEDPRKYADRSVTVSGEVTEVFSFMVIKYFVVRDKTGQLAVVTEKTLPRKGAQISVHGKVKEAFSLGDQQLLVLVEDGDKR